jgi:hypothetical protein
MTYETPNLKILVIHVTYRCNATCDNCSNLCYQAPSREDMSVQDVEKVINDSITLNYKWDKIVLQGGECTLHPQFNDICQVLIRYKQWNPSSIIAVNTNGFATRTQECIKDAEQQGFSIENSYKSKDIIDKTIKYDYIPVNIAPIDVSCELQKMGCFQSSVCGVTVNNQGYWECSPSAAASRVFPFYKPICTELKDLTEDGAKRAFDEHCKYCGFALPTGRIKDQQTSATWQKYFDLYNKKET